MLNNFFILMSLLPFLLSANEETLIAKALEARSRAYAPYSNYYVGAALLTREGDIIQGANVENASYGLTICAERAAVMAAAAMDKRDYVAIAVATKDGGFPCGACRQVLNEFNSEMEVISVDESGQITSRTTLDKLLPNAFGPQNLE